MSQTMSERIHLCKRCFRREMNIHRGILCGITGQKPDFEKNCPAFESDPEYRDVITTRQVTQSKGTVSISTVLYNEMVGKQNFPLAVICGIAAGLLCSLVWAAFTVASKVQIGFFALAIGAVVGLTIRYTGKGVTHKFGFLGGIVAVLSCFVGNFFASIGFIAIEMKLNFWQALTHFDYSMLPLLMKETFRPMDLLFYAFAGIEGYKLAFRKVEIKRSGTIF